LLTCYRYIELNPVRAGLVSDPADYPWCSYRDNAFGQADPLVTPHERYWSLGSDAISRQAAYRALFEEVLDDRVLREIRESTNKRWALGSERFRNELAAQTTRHAQPSRRGGKRSGAGRPRRGF
jgi:putative transposase